MSTKECEGRLYEILICFVFFFFCCNCIIRCAPFLVAAEDDGADENGNSLCPSFYAVNLTASFYSHKLLPTIHTFLNYRIFLGKGYFIRLENLLLVVWIAGGVYYLCKRMYGYMRYKKELEKIAPVREERILTAFHLAYEDVFPHKKNKVRVIQSEVAGTCAIFGLTSPPIILPAVEFTDEELRLTRCRNYTGFRAAPKFNSWTQNSYNASSGSGGKSL